MRLETLLQGVICTVEYNLGLSHGDCNREDFFFLFFSILCRAASSAAYSHTGGFRVGGGVHDSYTFQCGLVGSFTSPGLDTQILLYNHANVVTSASEQNFNSGDMALFAYK